MLGPTRISTGDPFGLFSASKVIAPERTLVVFPIIFEIKSFVFPPGLLPGGQVIRRKSADITPHAAGVREYVHGDAMKRIHWPTSARRGHLMVKEFEQDPQAEIWLYLDSQKDVHYAKPYQLEEIPIEMMMFKKRPKFKLPPATLEYSISITASLSHYFIGQRRAVGYVSAGQTFIVHSAEHSERQEAKILETLAFVEANGSLRLRRWLPYRHPNCRRAQVLFSLLQQCAPTLSTRWMICRGAFCGQWLFCWMRKHLAVCAARKIWWPLCASGACLLLLLNATPIFHRRFRLFRPQ